MGEVYLAFDTRLQRDVALKVLTAQDANASRRLTREALLASKLTHPLICTVFEAGESDGRAFIAMDDAVRVSMRQGFGHLGAEMDHAIRRERAAADQVR